MQLAALRMLLLAVAPARTSVAGGGSLHFRSAPGGAGPDLSTIDAVLAHSWAGVLQRDLFGTAGGSVELNSSDCTPQCNQTCASLPAGWVQVSPAGQIDAGTLWSRDTGTFLRELVAFGEIERAKLVALNLVQIAPVNAAGFRAWPGHYNCRQPQGQPDEQDGVSAIVIALVNLLQRLSPSDPAYATLSQFLRGPEGPAKFFVQTLATAPLIAGSGEFGGGAAPGIWFNVVQNAYAAGALLAMASLEKDANDSAQQAHYTEAATTLRSNMLQHLVNSTDGSWYWCVNTSSLLPSAAVLNMQINKGFGGLNGVLYTQADLGDLVPAQGSLDASVPATWPAGFAASNATFNRLWEVPMRKRLFEQFGIWTQFDPPFRDGCATSPSYGQGYAMGAMLLSERTEMAGKALLWLANATYDSGQRHDPYYLFEQLWAPKRPLSALVGCGELNLVCVMEPLKTARLMLGIDDTSSSSSGIVRWIPRLPVQSWGVGAQLHASLWPLRFRSEGVNLLVWANLTLTARADQGVHAELKILGGGAPIPTLLVRLPTGADGSSWRWVTTHNVTKWHSEPEASETVLHVAGRARGRTTVAAADGSAQRPYATLVEARNAARTLRSDKMQPSAARIRVLVHAGVYSPLSLTAADSGRGPGNGTTVWQAVGDGPAIISAGLELPSHLFKPSTSHAGAFEADLTTVGLESYGNISALDTGCGNLIHSNRSAVYFNMQPLTLARYPNIATDGTWNYAYIDHGGNSSFAVEAGDPVAARLPVWAAEREPWLHGYWKYSWADGYVPLTSAEALPNGTVKAEIRKTGGEGGSQVLTGARFYGVNLLCELDAPGEYYIDDLTGTLYMIPPLGAGPPSQWPDGAVYVSKNTTGLSLVNVSHVELRGLTVHAAVHSGVAASGVDSVVLNNLTVAGHGAHGIEMDGLNSGVVNSVVHSVGGSGVRVTGGDTYTMTYGNSFVKHSHIHHVGLWKRTYQPNLFWGGVNNSYVGNVLEDGPAMCIWGGGNAVSSEMGGVLTTFDGNRLSRCVTETCDQGAFHTCGDAGQAFISWGNVYKNGIFEDIRPDPIAVKPPRSLPPICYPHAVGFYLDCEISGWLGFNNTFMQVDQAILVGGGRNITIDSNAAHGSDTFVVYLNEGMNWMHANCLEALDGLDHLLAGPASRLLAKHWPELWEQGQGRNLPTNHSCNPYDNHLTNNIYANTTTFSSATMADVVSWGGTISNNTCTTPRASNETCAECTCSTSCKCPEPWVPASACVVNATKPTRPYRACAFEVEIGLYTSCAQGHCTQKDTPYQNLTLKVNADADDCFRVDGCGMRGPSAASCMSGWNISSRSVVSANGTWLGDGSCCSVANRVLRWRKIGCAANSEGGQ